MTKYAFKTPNGALVEFKAELDGNVLFMYNGICHIGKVESLDDDGYIGVSCGDKVLRIYNDDIINSYCGRKWCYEDNDFVPHLCSNADPDGNDWIVANFSEGVLYMDNYSGIIRLKQPDGTILKDYI